MEGEEILVSTLLSRPYRSANYPDLCLREFSKSLTKRGYTWYVNLKAGSVYDSAHLVSLFSTKSFCAEAKFTLAELGKTSSILERIWVLR